MMEEKEKLLSLQEGLKVVKKYDKNAFIPNLIKTPAAVVSNTTPAGKVLLQAATKKAIANGAIPFFTETVDTKKDKT